MKINSRCILCQISSLGKVLAGMDLTEEQRLSIVQDMLRHYANCDADMPSPEAYIAPWERIVAENDGIDPMLDAKRADDELGLSLLPMIQREIGAAEDKFDTAMRYAIAANIMDPMPQHHGMTMDEVLKTSANTPLFVDDSKELVERLKKAEKILYLTDNAGEIAVDRLFIETMYRLGITTPDKVTVAVRGHAANNDATMEDAERVGMTGIAKVIGNGDNTMGVLLHRCSEEFKEAVYAADVIVSKGMGNFECLHDWRDKPVFYLFITKCETVAELSGSPVGSFMCMLRE
ncbi:MAG: damage-control phosphatase ARMT1 family protein [Christensenellales bacterium]|jgi:uncharacterized protein with ATP-grasp and redox domains